MILIDPELDSHPLPVKPSSDPAQEQHGPKLPTVRTLTRYLTEAQAAVRLKGQVTVLLTTDKAIRRLNREFRGKDKATDVLSFPAMQMPGLKASEQMAGDLAICAPTAARQAAQQGHALAVELRVLMLHGLLHLAGYDHEADQGQMARRESALRAKLKLPLGLIERAAEPQPRKAVAKKSVVKKAAAQKTAAKKSVAKKAAVKKTAVKKLSATRSKAPAKGARA